MKITRFEDLECWQEARKLVSAVYGTTMNGNFKKDLRLSGQIQAAATSVMANISEGFVRRSTREFIQFLFVGMSSAAEVQSHLYVALDQRYIDQKYFGEIYDQETSYPFRKRRDSLCRRHPATGRHRVSFPCYRSSFAL